MLPRLLAGGRLLPRAIAAAAIGAPLMWAVREELRKGSDRGENHLPMRQMALCHSIERADNFDDFKRDYELSDQQLGDGSFSVVRLGRCRKTGAQVAVKIVPREKVH